ncbi:hypothetical protein QTQ03_17745 [Micromonospora sp. WMMA1363]|uniref:hypothetical protein n=1 Tax=Micromonospora sp. WMMA1363 TaxID=3053985 RepID=UPI00259CCF0D|nr:hypothetical protein [Micromonospora sp. WMMA1363]MDM4721356.1 hypothetical protein [Micromonospora sp. WMMA1363]
MFRRPPEDPAILAARAAAHRESAAAEVERARLMAQLDREQQEAAAEHARRQAVADEQERRRRAAARRVERAERRERQRTARAEFAAKLRPVLPLLLINGGAAYAQAAYAYSQIAPAAWNGPSRVTFAVAFAAALESIAVYVQWHAHDALLLKAHATAASLRRAAWLIAAVVAAINYAHFADGSSPTAAAVAFALLSLLSPWLWGLHTRRAQHVQLLAEDADLIDDAGVEFSPKRRRMFPIRSLMAARWSIEHNERDPRKAWDGYHTERAARTAGRQATHAARKAERAARAEAKKDKDTPKTAPAAPLVQREPVREPARPARPTARSLTAGERVIAAHTAEPTANHERIARLAEVSVSTVKRHRPRPDTGSPTTPDAAATPVNGTRVAVAV